MQLNEIVGGTCFFLALIISAVWDYKYRKEQRRKFSRDNLKRILNPEKGGEE